MADELNTTDPIERVVADALKEAGVSYYAPAGNDIRFFLAGCDTYIECKAYHSDRIVDQMKRAPNMIAIQGMGAALTFAHLIRRAMPNESQSTAGIEEAASLCIMRTIYQIVDEIAGALDPPPDYRTTQEVRAWTRGILDVQCAIGEALNV